MTLQTVGVVVIGRNEGQRLVDCLESLLGSGSKIVYVDSGSSDGSLQAAERLAAVPHALSSDRPFNAARARNAGVKRLKEVLPQVEFIQFVDGDCVLAQDWIEKARNFLSTNTRAAVVCGRRRERFPERSVYNRLMDLEWDTRTGQVEACGGDAMMRREAFDSVGGFDETIVAGEEPELCLRLRQKNWTIWRIDAEMTLHDAALRRFSQWWKRSVRSGYGCAQIWGLHNGRASPGLSRQLLRCTVWSLVGPLALLGGALVSKWLLALLLIYPAQVARMALRPSAARSDPWAYATIMTACQFAGFQGVCKYVWNTATSAVPSPADYK